MLSLLLKLAITIWLMGIALWDRRTRKIPNQLTLPVMLVVGGYRLAQAIYPLISPLMDPGGQKSGWLSSLETLFPRLTYPLFTWIAWLVIFVLWSLNFMGGGDAKLLMGLFAIFPTLEFTLAFSCLIVLIGLPWLILAHWDKGGRAIFKSLYVRLLTLQILPTAEELAERGRPHAWLFCLPGVIYTWLLW